MRRTKLPFFIEQTKENLTDRGGLTLVDEFIAAIGLKKEIEQKFPKPGSGRGISGFEYIRSLILHFVDGGRYLEDIYDIKNDKGFCKLIKIKHMPTPDAIGDWLRRSGERGHDRYIKQFIDYTVKRYLKENKNEKGYILDVDSTLIRSEKGDAVVNYQGFRSYHPMLGFLSSNVSDPICSYVKFRQGNASAQTDILDAIKHTQEQLKSCKKRLNYFRSDSAGYQAEIINYCDSEGIRYTITADLDTSVYETIGTIDESIWQTYYDSAEEGIKTRREYAETVHFMGKSNHSFRLIVIREAIAQIPLFDWMPTYKYHCIISNIPKEEMDAQKVIWHHNGRGNAERYIEDGKYGLNLRYVPCGQFNANLIYFTIGMLAYNVVKLMQLLVLPSRCRRYTILTLRERFFRLVGKVLTGSRQLKLKVNKSLEEIKELILVRDKIYALKFF
ncbi:IS1380 family transposase [Calditrichota bacterium LG25]